MQLHAVRINTRYYNDRQESKHHFNYGRIMTKSNKKQRASKHFEWEMPMAKLSERVQSTAYGYVLWARSCLAPRKSRVTQRAGTRWASRVSHPAHARRYKHCLPLPPCMQTFIFLQTRRRLLLERPIPFLEPTQILHNSILEYLVSLNTVLFPYQHFKPFQKTPRLFAGLPQALSRRDHKMWSFTFITTRRYFYSLNPINMQEHHAHT